MKSFDAILETLTNVITGETNNTLTRNGLTSKGLRKNKKGRSCRIEELENREMLAYSAIDGGDSIDFQNNSLQDNGQGIVTFAENISTANAVGITAVATTPEGFNEAEYNSLIAQGLRTYVKDWALFDKLDENGKEVRDENGNVVQEQRVIELEIIWTDPLSVTALDLTAFIALKKVDISDHALTSLNLSGCAALTDLTVVSPALTTINLTDCESLENLTIGSNDYRSKLNDLNLSDCGALKTLILHDTELKALNLEGQAASLAELRIGAAWWNGDWQNWQSGLEKIENIYDCVNLVRVEIFYTQLEELDLIGLTKLNHLDIGENAKLTKLLIDPAAPLQEFFDIQGNRLDFAMLGNFVIPEDWSWWEDAEQKPIILPPSIEHFGIVDLAPYLGDLSEKDVVIRWSVKGEDPAVDVPGIVAMQEFGQFGFPGLNYGDVVFCEIEAIDDEAEGLVLRSTQFIVGYETSPDWANVRDRGLADYATWDVVEGQVRLVELRAVWSALTGTLDLSGFDALKSVNVHGNQLTSINLSGCSALELLNANANKLAGADALVFDENGIKGTSLEKRVMEDDVQLNNLNLTENALTLSDLWAILEGYNGQTPDTEQTIDFSPWIVPGTEVDLTAGYLRVGNNDTQFKWFTEDDEVLGEGTLEQVRSGERDYYHQQEWVNNRNVGTGIFIFADALAGEKIFCEMTHVHSLLAGDVVKTDIITLAPGATQLARPEITAVTVLDATTLRVEWNRVNNASGYWLEYSTDGFRTAPIRIFVEQSAETPLSYILGGDNVEHPLTTGVQYSIRIVAVGSGLYSDSGRSAVQTATPHTKLDVPEMTAEASGLTTVHVQWDDDENADRFEVQYSADGENEWTSVGVEFESRTAATITGLEPGTWYVQVRAVGNGTAYFSSDWSVPVKMQTDALPEDYLRSDAAAVTQDSITLEWDEMDGAVRYEILQGGVLVYSGTETTTTITDLAANTVYQFRVQVVYEINDAEFPVVSESIAVKTLPVALPTPSNVQAEAASENSITVKWTPVQGARGYEVIYSSFDAEPLTVTVSGGNSSESVITGLQPNTTYSVSVKALGVTNVSSDSLPSDIVEVTTLKIPLPAPKQIKATANSKATTTTVTSVTLTWAAWMENEKFSITHNDVPIDQDSIHWLRDGNGRINGAVISGLLPGKSYKLTVIPMNANDEIAYDDKGRVVSSTVTAKTQKYTAPRSLKVDKTLTGLDTVTLNWTFPNARILDVNTAPGGLVPPSEFLEQRYLVTVLQGRTQVSFSIILPDGTVSDLSPAGGIEVTDSKVQIVGLTAGTRYTVSVQAVVVDAEGNRVSDVESKAAKRSVSTAKYNAVKNLQGAALSPNSVSLNWSKSDYAATTHYRISFVEGSGVREILHPIDTLSSGASTVTIEITGLDASERYRFSVVALEIGVNEDGTLNPKPLQQSKEARVSVRTLHLS